MYECEWEAAQFSILTAFQNNIEIFFQIRIVY